MPENEFEKKISSEMQELRFRPSESVWLRVEERIREKKKRRVFIVIFLLAGLALLGYWQRGNLFGKNENDIEKSVAKSSPGEKQKDENSKPSGETNNLSTENRNTEVTKEKEKHNTAGDTRNDNLKDDKSVEDKKDIGFSKNEINKPKKVKDGNKRKPVSGETKTGEREVSIAVVAANSKKKNNVADERSKELKTNPETKAEPDQVNQVDAKPTENRIDSAKAVTGEQEKNATTKTDTVLKAEEAKTPPAPIVKKVPSEKKWKWGSHITPGVSSLSDNGLSFPQNNSNRSYYANPLSSGSGGPPTSQKPSDVKPGFAFQAGAFVQRQLSSRTSVSLGLQYGYYSNVLHIGNMRSSGNVLFYSGYGPNANQVYNAGSDTIKYTNSYHFVELPFLFQWQLNKNKAKPFSWSTGFTIGQLISSNAIMYDTAFNGTYHQNKKLLNKTQFSISTAFSWTIANNKKLQWSVGPAANIHLNKLIDNPFDNAGYLFFVGLRTGILFNQKK